MHNILYIYTRTNILKVLIYGFVNGMSALLCGNTLNFWLASENIDYKIIGLFSLIAFPSACKYFISFLISKYQIFKLKYCSSRYRPWLILSQVSITLSLVLMSFLNPEEDLWLIAILGFFISLSSVVQYIILNGNRINILEDSEQGPGSAVYNTGYRIGMFLIGAGVIFATTYTSWSVIYISLAILYIIMTIIIELCYKETTTQKSNIEYTNLRLSDLISIPVKHFKGYKSLILTSLIIVLYQMPNSIAITMLNPFLLFKEYTPDEIVSSSKIIGFIMVIIGGLISGPIISKIGIRNSLISFMALNIFGYLLFFILSIVSKNIVYLSCVTAGAAFIGGMSTTAYISFISGISEGKHSTILYALFSSLVGLSWVLFPSFSGIIVKYSGWPIFFIIITILSLIMSVFLCFIPEKIYRFCKST
jgi:MFS transporter, PAT family, beta-lactamase induction signal transducer AmpG